MTGTELIVAERKFNKGDRIEVEEFFWVEESKCLGFVRGAAHGHRLDFGGSVDVGDVLEVRGVEGDELVVVVHKHELPYGAPCPHGMMFLVSIEQVLTWDGKRKRADEIAAKRAVLYKKYIGG